MDLGRISTSLLRSTTRLSIKPHCLNHLRYLSELRSFNRSSHQSVSTNHSRISSSCFKESNRFFTPSQALRSNSNYRANFSHTSEPIFHQVKTKHVYEGNLDGARSGQLFGQEERDVEEFGWKPIPRKISLFRRVSLYQALAKSRLSSLIVLTTMASYALCPVPDNLVTSSLTTLLATATGTYLCSASANTLNQIFETPFDAQMSRTRARPLVRRLVSLPHATTLAFSSGLTGAIVLATMVNPTTACLGVANLILYAFFYTPLKRISITNTWLGALVGAIPALMGATAAGAPLNQLSSWLPAGLLYVWQFPHFNSLAHTLRRDYCRAGYQMMSNVTAELNSRVSLRYALMTIPLCSYLVPSYGLTNQLFGWISLIPNLFLIAPAFRFWLSTPRATPNLSYSKTKELVHKVLSFEGTKARQDLEAKKLFWASLIHLPCILILMMVCKSSQSQDDNNGEIRE